MFPLITSTMMLFTIYKIDAHNLKPLEIFTRCKTTLEELIIKSDSKLFVDFYDSKFVVIVASTFVDC